MSKIKIRKSVFETNSSSTHSIHIDNKTMLMDTSLLSNEDGEIVLTGGEFGWEWQRYNDALTKANYASIENSGADRDLLIQAITEQTGARQVNINHIDWVYIDHQSTGLLRDMNLEELKNWIFNPNSWLVTGNDNGSEPSDIKDFPETDENGVEHPFKYTHEIKIEIKDIVFKIKGLPENNPKRFFEVLESKLDWDNGKFEKDGEDYMYSLSDDDIYMEKSNLKEGYFIVSSWKKLHDRAQEIFEKSKNSDLIIEKFSSKKNVTLSDWDKKRKIIDNLLKNNFEDFTLKVKFSVKEL
jgi:hypothetical protein